MLPQRQPNVSWSYKNLDEWPKNFPCANGQCQSPINIITNDTVTESFSPLTFSSKYNSDVSFSLIHTGQQVLGILAPDHNSPAANDLWITGINLIGKYHFSNFHIHWGQDDTHGSEHEINGHRYSGEVHIVHRNNETQQPAVLAFFLKVSENSDQSNEWERFVKLASQLKEPTDTIDVDFNLSRLIQMKPKEFYRYAGSLTTPPCTEGVVWTVFPYEVPIKEESFELLRRKLMPNAYRPVQPLNNRIVSRNL